MTGRSNLTEFEELYIGIHRKITAEWQKRIDRVISGSQALILWKLEKNGPQKITTLAEHLCITPGAVTSLADKLIASGYAIRERDTSDRRVVYLDITDKGKELLQLFRADSRQVVEQVFDGVSDEDIGHLIRIYRKVLSNLEANKEE